MFHETKVPMTAWQTDVHVCMYDLFLFFLQSVRFEPDRIVVTFFLFLCTTSKCQEKKMVKI